MSAPGRMEGPVTSGPQTDFACPEHLRMRDNHGRESAMTVHCPHCLTGYLLPERLLGAGGARVRCPSCQGVFVVLPEGEATVEGVGEAGPELQEATSHAASERGGEVTFRSGETSGEASGEVLEPGPPAEPAQVAASVLGVLADFLGDALTRSRSRGTVLSDHGPAIIAVWDEYRRRAGVDAPPAVFRAALRDRCGVDLSQKNGN